MSVFETAIRFLGGLLSAYAFSGDEVSILHSHCLMVCVKK